MQQWNGCTTVYTCTVRYSRGKIGWLVVQGQHVIVPYSWKYVVCGYITSGVFWPYKPSAWMGSVAAVHYRQKYITTDTLQRDSTIVMVFQLHHNLVCQINDKHSSNWWMTHLFDYTYVPTVLVNGPSVMQTEIGVSAIMSYQLISSFIWSCSLPIDCTSILEQFTLNPNLIPVEKALWPVFIALDNGGIARLNCCYYTARH